MYLETYGYAHILGGLFGQALGDAWAVPAWYRPRQTWEHYEGWIDRLLPAPPDHPRYAGFQTGQITDNTQQMLTLAQIVISDKKITVAGAAEAMVNWYDQTDGDNAAYIDPQIRRAIAAIKAGEDPHKTGINGDTSSGVTRISPIGLIYPGQPEAAIEDTIAACTPTHYTDVAISGACAVAAALAQSLTPDTTLESIIDVAIWGADIGRRYGVPWMGASIARKIEFAVQLTTDTTLSEQDRIQNLYDLVGSTLATVDAVPCAFGVLAMADGNPVDAAIYAAALSGNASAVGAMAGAIAGTWQSVDLIPAEYIDIIRQVNSQYDFDAIANGLYEIALQNYSPMPEPKDASDSIEDILG